MKRFLIALVLISLVFTSCKKDDETDPRDQFIGSYSTTMVINVSGIDYYDTYTGTNEISKSSESGRIIITDDNGTEFYAKVTGNNYVYDKFTNTISLDGETFTEELTGTGTINGNIINESGVYKLYYQGEEFTGTWTCTLIKK